MIKSVILQQFESEQSMAAEKAVRDIDRLVEHLGELRASVIAWNAGESARTPEPYGNAFGDAAASVAKFRVIADATARVRAEEES